MPDYYKHKIKPLFSYYDLVANPKELLLGGSRIDLAALVIQKTILKNLKENGEAIFFLPLSLFLNDGASNHFRKYQVKNIHFCINKIFDFQKLKVFKGVSTRYGLVHLLRNKQPIFPVSYKTYENEKWETNWAQPLFAKNAPLSILKTKNFLTLQNLKPIKIPKYAIPRQGINPCGACNIFFFNKQEKITNQPDHYRMSNKINSFILPKKYLYPLLIADNFQDNNEAFKWVLLPYNNQGKPLEWKEIEKDSYLKNYLLQNRRFFAR